MKQMAQTLSGAVLAVVVMGSAFAVPAFRSSSSSSSAELFKTRSSYVRSNRLCGVKLINVLAKLCSHTFARPSSDSQSPSPPLYSPPILNVDLIEDQRRFKRGIVERCCIQSCPHSALLSYCAPPPAVPNPPLFPIPHKDAEDWHCRRRRLEEDEALAQDDWEKKESQPSSAPPLLLGPGDIVVISCPSCLSLS